MSTLTELLRRADAARAALIERLAAEDTNCYRLFHGSVEGVPGLAIDRYGEQILAQTFHKPLTDAELEEIRAHYREALPELALVYNDRSDANSRVSNALSLAEQAVAQQDVAIRENGVAFHYQARHKGQDPWLFLDLRAARRRVMQLAEGKSVLNLFAYTCGVGVAAAKAGASFVLNVDFAESSLSVGRANAKLNLLASRPRCLHSDVFAAVRQLSGIGQPDRVRGKRMPPFPKLEPRQFDLVFLDPPRYSKSPFGVVDLVNDYQALFKPALLATAPGGMLVCCNNVAEVDGDAWLESLKRSAAKAGREVRAAEWIVPDEDFPSIDGKPPLKIVLLSV
ncbi:class I SAM-dependent rRNA methyltransferase [Chromobacterium vaccinii]|uniref:SAM-dependent methyltransferase n=1 Tax=Chromobacterium vaccinii TaxID=1108595 RepID=A0A1D9LI54_9NEIS|nr:class I SAM-dependent methyltransferase [Chromobacterium vaccinii]AOZ50927.1 SAM-dependent methyltransferase [Chromobacterium vaccinii]QND82624.1 putative methyltransferase [Chromobacterium vaccinii]QND87854.1 putative methyltransferase [Chromobacterium vaccinii]